MPHNSKGMIRDGKGNRQGRRLLLALDPEQEEILAQMVEAQRSVPRQERSHFILDEMMQGSHLVHPAIRIDVFKGDLDALEMAGLIYIATIGGRGSLNYEVSPQGYEYYGEMKKRHTEPANQVEEEVRRYLDAASFRERHSVALSKWNEAAARLWSPNWEQELTNIGHLCREAIQEFADDLIQRFNPPDVSPEKAKDINRIAAVLEQQKERFGKREVVFLNASSAYLDALLDYWKATSGLVQRQEHGVQKGGAPLVWEDARRVVFQTAVVMFEVARALR